MLRVETKVSALSKRVVTLDKGKRHECTRIYFTTGQKVTKGKQVVLDLPLRRREQTKSAYYHLLMTNKQTMKNVIENRPILWRDLMQALTIQQPQVSVVLRSHPPHFMDYHIKTTFLPWAMGGRLQFHSIGIQIVSCHCNVLKLNTVLTGPALHFIVVQSIEEQAFDNN